ncbi:MAG: hypothetical protein IJW21_08960, partial [Clostridia bacterium]|nr:hypothetical protein [Clostridia bacterium]
STAPTQESFRPPFSKGGGVEGQSPPLRRFSFVSFSLYAYSVKEKSGQQILCLNAAIICINKIYVIL